MTDIQIALYTTVVAALVGSYLTFLTFKRQRLWHEKYQAYKEIISAVEDVRYWGNEENSSFHFLPSNGYPDGKTHYEFLSEALRKLQYYSNAGSIIFSDDFCILIENMLSEINNERFEATESAYGSSPEEQEHNFANHAAKVRDIAIKHLPQLIKSAKREL